jgi:hypothetical protein
MGNLPASLYGPPDLMTALFFIKYLLSVKLQSGNIRVLVGYMRDIQSIMAAISARPEFRAWLRRGPLDKYNTD